MKQGTLIEAPARVIVGEVVRFRVPYPPSVNRLIGVTAIRKGKKWIGQVYKTGEHKLYLGAVSNALRVAALRNPSIALLPFRGPVSLTLKYFRPMKAGDIDNPLKALFDSLISRPDEDHAGAWVDDSQVCELKISRFDDKEDPRVELEIGEVT